MLTCAVCPPICAPRHLNSLFLSCPKGLGRASTQSNSALPVSLKAQGGSAQEEASCSVETRPPPQSTSCHHQPPVPGADLSHSLGAAGDGQKSELRATGSYAEVSSRPQGRRVP